eukprot:gene3280-13304_t
MNRFSGSPEPRSCAWSSCPCLPIPPAPPTGSKAVEASNLSICGVKRPSPGSVQGPSGSTGSTCLWPVLASCFGDSRGDVEEAGSSGSGDAFDAVFVPQKRSCWCLPYNTVDSVVRSCLPSAVISSLKGKAELLVPALQRSVVRSCLPSAAISSLKGSEEKD